MWIEEAIVVPGRGTAGTLCDACLAVEVDVDFCAGGAVPFNWIVVITPCVLSETISMGCY